MTARRILVGLAASALVLAADWFDRPQREHVCADNLGIVWSVEDGATERLADWRVCVERAR